MAESLRIAVGHHAIGERLRSGESSDPRVALSFEEVSPIHRAFAPMVRDAAYDISELAIVTALQAVAFGRPVVVLPVVVAARRQRSCLVTLADRAVADPTELVGRRIGVRAYTQTTGMWVRQHLVEDYGLRPEQFTWVTQEGAHVAEYDDPPFVRRELTTGPLDALNAGELDAAILGNDLPPGLATVIPGAAARDEAWVTQHRYEPINHLVVASFGAVTQHPDAVRATYDLLCQAGRGLGLPVGFEALLEPLEEIIAACVMQGLLDESVSATDVLAPARELLGDRNTHAQ